ncbi:hypothetical protein Syun_006925 [Stephania yunnanensis]|uniref:Uncharacterized protein n=1 Tax=Stephania yunnanensis TaxID=152371 RepID=A0AAP0PZT4_9MAGN
MATTRPCISSSSRRVFMGSSSILGCESRENSWAKLTSSANIASVRPFFRSFSSTRPAFDKVMPKAMAESSDKSSGHGLPIDLRDEERNRETKGEEPEIAERRTRDRRRRTRDCGEKNQRSQREEPEIAERREQPEIADERGENNQRSQTKENEEIADQTTRDRREKSYGRSNNQRSQREEPELMN